MKPLQQQKYDNNKKYYYNKKYYNHYLINPENLLDTQAIYTCELSERTFDYNKPLNASNAKELLSFNEKIVIIYLHPTHIVSLSN